MNVELSYLNHGLYAHHLRRVFELSGREDVLVLVFERMVEHASLEYQRICRFLDTRDDLMPDIVGRTVNSYVTFRSLTISKLAPNLRTQFEHLVRRLNVRRKASYPSLSGTDEAFLAEFFSRAKQGATSTSQLRCRTVD